MKIVGQGVGVMRVFRQFVNDKTPPKSRNAKVLHVEDRNSRRTKKAPLMKVDQSNLGFEDYTHFSPRTIGHVGLKI